MNGRRGPLLVLFLLVGCLGALVGLARLDSAGADGPHSKPAAQPPTEPAAHNTSRPTPIPEPAPAKSPTVSADADPPIADSTTDELTEWEMEAQMDEWAEQGKASMQRTEEARLEAQLAEACANYPSGPFC
jgi:hypothetical protein